MRQHFVCKRSRTRNKNTQSEIKTLTFFSGHSGWVIIHSHPHAYLLLLGDGSD